MSYSCRKQITASSPMKINAIAVMVWLSSALAAGPADAETAWVSDQFEITLRTGPSTSNAIHLMVRSGTELEIIAQDPDKGYTQVRTGGGTEGWVLSRYLMDEAPAPATTARIGLYRSPVKHSVGGRLTIIRSSERWLSGLRRSLGKRVYVYSVPRVRIAPSPPDITVNIYFKRE